MERIRNATEKFTTAHREVKKLPDTITDLGQMRGLDGALKAYYSAAKRMHLGDMLGEELEFIRRRRKKNPDRDGTEKAGEKCTRDKQCESGHTTHSLEP